MTTTANIDRQKVFLNKFITDMEEQTKAAREESASHLLNQITADRLLRLLFAARHVINRYNGDAETLWDIDHIAVLLDALGFENPRS